MDTRVDYQGMGARLSAWRALLSDDYIFDYLNHHFIEEKREFNLSREIAAGTCRMERALDYMLERASHKKLKISRKARALFRLTAYQIAFMDRVPDFAAIDEGVKLAKKHLPGPMGSLLNALCRNLDTTLPDDPAISYSLPDMFVEAVRKQYPTQAGQIFQACNVPPKVEARDRKTGEFTLVEDRLIGPDHYIQNKTTWELLKAVVPPLKEGARVLDVCGAPGGKAIGVYDLYPHIQLTVNDISEKRLERVRENLDRCAVPAQVTCLPAEEITGEYDLIIVDVPCSNSGVLAKRPEARWRINESQVAELTALQTKILDNAVRCLAPGGAICYMTCSILAEENQAIAHGSGLQVEAEKVILPGDGFDGGYGARLNCEREMV